LSSAVSLSATTALDDRNLLVEVTTRNLTGHKLPTGLPGRRLWLHVTARDANERIVFESGAWNPDTGELVFPQTFYPHRAFIDRSDQTAIYEAVTEDAGGKLTNLLTKAARFRKDNRLLPVGFKNESRLPEGVVVDWIAPIGTSHDVDFEAGQDTVQYRIPLSTTGGPMRVTVEACFQSIRPVDAASIEGLPRGPEVIATVEAVAVRNALD
jgi:hypothetical protein